MTDGILRLFAADKGDLVFIALVVIALVAVCTAATCLLSLPLDLGPAALSRWL